MAFEENGLTCVDGGGQCQYNYLTADAQGVVAASGYFDAKYLNFKLGDVISVVSDAVFTPAKVVGGPAPHTMTGIGQKYFVSKLNDAATPRPGAQVELTAFA